MLKLLSSADLISILNAVLGVFAIIVLFLESLGEQELRIHISFSLILLGLLADGLDGIIARKFGKSKIGEYLEAMADMASMVVAPAVFIFITYSDLLQNNIFRNIYLFVAIVLFLFFGIVRLASFTVMKEKKYYVGIPASASAIILLVLSYLKVNFIFILPAVVIIGSLMASNIIFPKTNKKMNFIATILIFLTIIFGKNYYNFAPILLLIGIIGYTFGGYLYVNFTKKGRRKAL
ncbi:MAG: CDP-alcohol phosphatidyltransferase family protein [Psychroflexus sp.]